MRRIPMRSAIIMDGVADGSEDPTAGSEQQTGRCRYYYGRKLLAVNGQRVTLDHSPREAKVMSSLLDAAQAVWHCTCLIQQGFLCSECKELRV